MTTEPTNNNEQPPDDKHLQLLAEIKAELTKANATPEEQQAADVTFDDLRAMTTAEVMELDERLVHSILERGDQ